MEKLEVVTEEISSIKEISSLSPLRKFPREKDMLSIVTKEIKDVTHIISEEISRFLGTLRKFPQCWGS